MFPIEMVCSWSKEQKVNGEKKNIIAAQILKHLFSLIFQIQKIQTEK